MPEGNPEKRTCPEKVGANLVPNPSYVPTPYGLMDLPMRLGDVVMVRPGADVECPDDCAGPQPEPRRLPLLGIKLPAMFDRVVCPMDVESDKS